jgi:hypothetical protein
MTSTRRFVRRRSTTLYVVVYLAYTDTDSSQVRLLEAGVKPTYVRDRLAWESGSDEASAEEEEEASPAAPQRRRAWVAAAADAQRAFDRTVRTG